MKTSMLGWALAAAFFGFLAYAAYDSIKAYHSQPAPVMVGEMWLYVDPQTGCEYLRAGAGALTPRSDGSGRQMGCK